jgi:hypothetical protein
MFRTPKSPAKERYPEKLPFGYPSKLELRESLHQNGNVYVALVVHHKNIRAIGTETVSALNTDMNTADF